MSDLNQCQFIGRLGKEPDTRFMPSGEQVTSFSIAVGRQWKDKNKERQEETEWVNCSIFGKLAEVASEYLHKGSQVFISGRMKTDKWTDKQGVDRYSTKIIVERMQMLGGKPSGEQQEKKFEGGAATGGRAQSGFDDMDDDIPLVINELHYEPSIVSKALLRARRAR